MCTCVIPSAWPSQTPSVVAPGASNPLNKYFHEFSLVSCFAACRVGMFGRNCQQSCGADLNCKGLRFCLPDPYGCSCASGWFGSRCEKGQPQKRGPPSSFHLFPADCHSCVLRRQPVTETRTDQTASSAAAARTEEFATASAVVNVRQGGGDATVRSPVRLELKTKTVAKKTPQKKLYPLKLLSFHRLSHTDWAPQILDLEGNLERNLNSSPKIYCSATGNPLPSHNSIELRKPDGSVLKVESHSLLALFFSSMRFTIRRLHKSILAHKVDS